MGRYGACARGNALEDRKRRFAELKASVKQGKRPANEGNSDHGDRSTEWRTESLLQGKGRALGDKIGKRRSASKTNVERLPSDDDSEDDLFADLERKQEIASLLKNQKEKERQRRKQELLIKKEAAEEAKKARRKVKKEQELRKLEILKARDANTEKTKNLNLRK